MRYHLIHKVIPEKEQYLYFIGPVGLEVLGQYLYPCRFDSYDGNLKGYSAKYWRELTESEILLVPELNKRKKVQHKK